MGDILVSSAPSLVLKTFRSRGCGEKGVYINLPEWILKDNRSQRIAEEFLKLRYGVWDIIDEPLLVTSQQYSQCRGQTAKEVIMKHRDFSEKRSVNFSAPVFTVTKYTDPKYVVVLENSVMMNKNGEWDFIRAGVRHLILQALLPSAHLELVLCCVLCMQLILCPRWAKNAVKWHFKAFTV